MIDGGLSRLFQKHLPKFHWQRIETGAIARGVPDLNFCFKGNEGWIETKLARGKRVGMRPEQIGWLLRRTRAGGRCFIAIRKESELWLYRGALAGVLEENGLGEGREEGTFYGGPSGWDWEAIERILLINPL